MARQRQAIIITDQMASRVKAQVDSGKYGNDSEYFRDLTLRPGKARNRNSASFYTG
jgi:antitoxin ParD1/3/4